MTHQICENCQKDVATVTVIEIFPKSEEQETPEHREQNLCSGCADAKNLPHAPVPKKSFGDIWKLLQTSGQQAKVAAQVTCPDCGMTSEELRTRGRIGCAKDYELFASEIDEILERMHGAKRHEGRIPGVSNDEMSRMQTITTLKRELVEAIREEAYENAARIRDELQALGEGA